ncbi:MAG TPA: hypothetical protein P5328_00115 [Candidatus Paceibacterota bacterium]|nr:hypothetical protein [Candidatus Paceibacterota bacterium]HRZ34265.1 hypothetical protein [Candidatus Paceibacterota bacterium]
MESQINNEIGNEQNNAPQKPRARGGRIGPIIGSIIIIVLIVLGGSYYLKKVKEKFEPKSTETPAEEIITGTTTESEK